MMGRHIPTYEQVLPKSRYDEGPNEYQSDCTCGMRFTGYAPGVAYQAAASHANMENAREQREEDERRRREEEERRRRNQGGW